MQSSEHETSLIIPQKNSATFIFHILKGFHDQFILAEDKGGKTIGTNRDSPCISACTFFSVDQRSRSAIVIYVDPADGHDLDLFVVILRSRSSEDQDQRSI